MLIIIVSYSPSFNSLLFYRFINNSYLLPLDSLLFGLPFDVMLTASSYPVPPLVMTKVLSTAAE